MSSNYAYYHPGEWRFCCAICGRTDFRSGSAYFYWTGIKVCKYCYEQRNAQELIRPVIDPQAVPWTQMCSCECCNGTQRHPLRVLDAPNSDEVSLG